MRVMMISFGLLLAFTGVAMAGVADACLECHDPEDSLSLAGEGVDELVEMMQSIQAGDVKHPASLAELSDDDLKKIAAVLNGDG